LGDITLAHGRESLFPKKKTPFEGGGEGSMGNVPHAGSDGGEKDAKKEILKGESRSLSAKRKAWAIDKALCATAGGTHDRK